MLFEGVLLVSPAYNFSFISFLETVCDLENALFKKKYLYEPIVSNFVVENPFATNWVDLFWLWYDPFIRISRWKLIFQSYNWKAAMSEGSKGLIYEGFSTPPHLSYYEFTKVD
jgi:hypothetical protein